MSTVSLMTSLLTEDCSRFLPPQHRTLDHRLFEDMSVVRQDLLMTQKAQTLQNCVVHRLTFWFAGQQDRCQLRNEGSYDQRHWKLVGTSPEGTMGPRHEGTWRRPLEMEHAVQCTYLATCGSCRRSSNIFSVFSRIAQIKAAQSTPKISAETNNKTH